MNRIKKWIMNKIFWYLARKLDYSVVLKVGKHFHYNEIMNYMPDEMTVYFA